MLNSAFHGKSKAAAGDNPGKLQSPPAAVRKNSIARMLKHESRRTKIPAVRGAIIKNLNSGRRGKILNLRRPAKNQREALR
jgi:hypothetical protein